MLTKREIEILELAKEGQAGKEIALSLGISLDTVKTHLQHIREKLDARNTAQAVALSLKYGFLRQDGGVFSYE